MPGPRSLRQNRLPPAPPVRRHSVHSPSARREESSLERVRRIAREHQSSGEKFDPEKRGTWKGSSRDLVVNGMKKKFRHSPTQLHGTEEEFFAIESEPNDRNPYILVNPGDYGGSPGLIAFQFGAYGDTRLLVWARSWEQGADRAAEWLADYAPGHITSESAVAQLMKEAQQDEPALSEEEAYEKATADLYYTEAGWLTSHEMHGDDVPKGDPMYQAALKASRLENAAYELEFDLVEYGEKMQHWHSSGGDPIYAVGSYAFSGKAPPDADVIYSAQGELERLERSGKFSGDDLEELQDLINQTGELYALAGGEQLTSNSAGRQGRVEDGDYVVQGCYSDGRVAIEFGTDDEEYAIREAKKLLKVSGSGWFEGDRVRVITRDGELVFEQIA